MDFAKPKFYTRYNSIVGELFLISSATKLFEIEFDQLKQDKLAQLTENPNIPILEKTKNWLDQYFAGKKPSPKEIEIEFIGTDFQKTVWHELEEIGYGQTITYGELAKRTAKQMGKKSMANQAIGQAVGKNPIPILVPCHRVVGTNGNLTGYSGGLDKKIKFLEVEKVNLQNFYLPNNSTTKNKTNLDSKFKQIDLELD